MAALQQRLVDLGYWMGEPDGTYGQLTRQAVMAFQKVEGLGRDGVAGPATQAQLAAAGRPAPRGGDGIEIDLERQVIFIVQGGQVQWARQHVHRQRRDLHQLERAGRPGR